MFRLRRCLAAVVCLGGMSAWACERQPEAAPFQPDARIMTLRATSSGEHELQLVADQGTPAEAAVYARHVQKATGFPAKATLDDLLAYCGFDITGSLLETTPPDVLMARYPGRLLAIRFFAPGLADLSSVGGTAATKDVGWRTLVRLAVDPGSVAGGRGIGSLFVLFNVFQPRSELALDPFEPCRRDPGRCSPSNQVILVPRIPQPGSDAVYWLVFGPASDGGGPRSDHLTATIDGGDQASAGGGNPVKPYFLPAACAQCHGGSAVNGRLNYLDSDHWNLRTRRGDDFEDLATRSPHGVLFDGGRHTASPEFERAFSVLTRLNEEIRSQNAAAGGEDFAFRAVDHWLNLHASSPGFADPVARALPPSPSSPSARAWQATPDDRVLLEQLDRYCFRCHSVVGYHVFDKEAVLQRQASMARRVEAGSLRPGGMPLDRVLDARVVRDLSSRLRSLH